MDDKTVVESLDKTVLEDYAGPQKEKPSVKGWLTVWSGKLRGKDYPLFEGRNFVGTHMVCDIIIDEYKLPDFAFNIRIYGDKWLLIDIDSDSGILLNDEMVFRKEINDEDWIKWEDGLFRVKKR